MFSCIAVVTLALYTVILVVRNADAFVTTRRAVRLTGTLFEKKLIMSVFVKPLFRASNCFIPRPRTESAKNSLHYRESVLWNRIYPEVTLNREPNVNEKDYL